MTTKAPVAMCTFAFCISARKFQNLCKSEFQQDLLIKQELAKDLLGAVQGPQLSDICPDICSKLLDDIVVTK